MRTSHSRIVYAIAALILASACRQAAQPNPAANDSFDVLITNGRVVDGTGAPLPWDD